MSSERRRRENTNEFRGHCVTLLQLTACTATLGPITHKTCLLYRPYKFVLLVIVCTYVEFGKGCRPNASIVVIAGLATLEWPNERGGGT